MASQVVLYAPNVHTGGGLVLLRSLLSAWSGAVPLTAFLDARARERLVVPQEASVSWVETCISSRMNAEFRLRDLAKEGGTVLCFHGLPPLLSNPARIVLFLQNRLLIDGVSLRQFQWKTRLRVACERFLSRAFCHRVSEYVVQTPTMQQALGGWLARRGEGRVPLVRVLPFVDDLPEATNSDSIPEWDFVYVADGEGHKNHRNLIRAWQLLAAEGLRPSLALTLSPRDEALRREVETASESFDLRVRNLGQIPRDQVMALYANTRALIFPSTLESFGLPLIEAANMGLPIVASELDYVRDVCIPEQTFDPSSPISIARAVKRFLGTSESTVTLRTPAEFWDELLIEKINTVMK